MKVNLINMGHVIQPMSEIMKKTKKSKLLFRAHNRIANGDIKWR